jgi:hypothetical protein
MIRVDSVPKLNVVDKHGEDVVLDSIKKLSLSKKFQSVKQQLKLKKQVDNLKKDVKVVLSVANILRIDQIFNCVRQSVEDHIYLSEKDLDRCKEIRDEICVDLLKHMCDGNGEVAQALIEAGADKIKQTTVYRRNKKKIAVFFFVSLHEC